MIPQNKTQAVLFHLEKNGDITSLEAIQKYGATRLSAIIFNLRKDGYNIYSEREQTKDKYGHKVFFVRYYLIPKNTKKTKNKANFGKNKAKKK